MSFFRSILHRKKHVQPYVHLLSSSRNVCLITNNKSIIKTPSLHSPNTVHSFVRKINLTPRRFSSNFIRTRNRFSEKAAKQNAALSNHAIYTDNSVKTDEELNNNNESNPKMAKFLAIGVSFLLQFLIGGYFMSKWYTEQLDENEEWDTDRDAAHRKHLLKIGFSQSEVESLLAKYNELIMTEEDSGESSRRNEIRDSSIAPESGVWSGVRLDNLQRSFSEYSLTFTQLTNSLVIFEGTGFIHGKDCKIVDGFLNPVTKKMAWTEVVLETEVEDISIVRHTGLWDSDEDNRENNAIRTDSVGVLGILPGMRLTPGALSKNPNDLSFSPILDYLKDKKFDNVRNFVFGFLICAAPLAPLIYMVHKRKRPSIPI